MIETRHLSVPTRGGNDTVDITPEIKQSIEQSAVTSGTVTVFVTGSTAGLTTIEYEPGVVGDFSDMFERIIPKDYAYRHDRAWGDGNGHAHVRASLLGSSLVLPFADKKLLLGTWQQVILVDFDNRTRTRQVMLQIMGE